MTMPNLLFLPLNKDVPADANTKVLVAARRAAIPIRFGCGACRCGTCAVAVSGDGVLSPIAANEHELLTKMKLPVDGSIRLSCQARLVEGDVVVDLSFQDKYSPDTGVDVE